MSICRQFAVLFPCFSNLWWTLVNFANQGNKEKINYTMLYLKFINTAPPTCESIPRFLYQNGFSNVVEHDSKGWSPMCYACLQDVKRVVKQWNTVRFTGETCVFSLLGLKKREFKLENRVFTWFSNESLVNFYQKIDYDYIYIILYLYPSRRYILAWLGFPGPSVDPLHRYWMILVYCTSSKKRI